MPRVKANTAVRTASPQEPLTKLIRKTRQATRRRYSSQEKIRIVMEGIRGDEPVSTLCRREGISANVYYKWLKDFMEAGKSRLKGDETRDATRGAVHELRRENERLKQLVAELSLDNMVLKKSLL
jgi:transposase